MEDSRAALLSQLGAATSELDAINYSIQGRAVAQKREGQHRAAQLAATELASTSSRQVLLARGPLVSVLLCACRRWEECSRCVHPLQRCEGCDHESGP